MPCTSRRDVARYVSTTKSARSAEHVSATTTTKPLVLLFLTGLTSMGMEVVWIRQFTPYLGTVVYAFASILATYLVSTFLGLQIYRLWSKKNRQEGKIDLGPARPVRAALAGRRQSQSRSHPVFALESGNRSVLRASWDLSLRCWSIAGQEAIPAAPEKPMR